MRSALARGKSAAVLRTIEGQWLAKCANCTRFATTYDNLNALRFYQKRGCVIVSVHRNAVVKSRQLKPQIPLTGNDGIPLRDEIELEMILESDP